MSLTENLGSSDLLDSQNRLVSSARRILEEAIVAVPDAPPRFHWSGDARDAYALRLRELSAMLQRAETHLEAVALEIAAVSNA